MSDTVTTERFAITVDGVEIDHADTRAAAKRARNAIIYGGIGTQDNTKIEPQTGKLRFPDNGYPVRTPGHKVQRRLFKEDKPVFSGTNTLDNNLCKPPAGKPPHVTRVVFRKWYRKTDGNGVIALFPDDKQDSWMIQSYEHEGQHGAADYTGVVRRTKPATPEEYAALKRELESPPFDYVLRVVQRA